MGAAITAVVSTVLAALAAILVDWIRSDTKLTTVSATLDEASKELQFLDAWGKALQQIENLPEGEARAELRRSMLSLLAGVQARIAMVRNRHTATAAGTRAVGFAGRLLAALRLVVPAHPVVWIPQLAFYGTVALSVRIVSTWEAAVDYSARVLILVALVLFSALCWVSCFKLERWLSPENTERPANHAS